MCKVLQLPRSTFYYESKKRPSVDDVTGDVIEIFRQSRENYGTRKIKIELQKLGKQVSRRRIGRIMREQGLVSSYTVAQYKPKRSNPNESVVKLVQSYSNSRNTGIPDAERVQTETPRKNCLV
nr:IS3 family transposase [Exiguobacterium sp. s154]